MIIKTEPRNNAELVEWRCNVISLMTSTDLVYFPHSKIKTKTLRGGIVINETLFSNSTACHLKNHVSLSLPSSTLTKNLQLLGNRITMAL